MVSDNEVVIAGNKMTLSSRLSIALAIAASFLPASGNPYHPEWGPEPPVAPFTHDQLPSERVVHPLIFPVLGKCRWNDDFNVERGPNRHTGIDIRAPKWTPISAPISGVIGFKDFSFWIYGYDGWAVLGTHLNDDNLGTHDHAGGRDVMFAPELLPGQHVEAGQFIGYVGMSGDATAPHLHLELYKPGPGPTAPRIRDPYPSLKAATIIPAPKPNLPQPERRPQQGELRVEGCLRRVDPQQHLITLILTMKQWSDGDAARVTQVAYANVTLSDGVVAQAGGWSALQALGSKRQIGVCVPLNRRVDGSAATSILIAPQVGVEIRR